MWGKAFEPWYEIEDFSTIILEKVSILDLLDRYDVEYAKIYAGNFSYKSHCPLPAHLGGNERSASFYVSEDDRFHCFGCNSNGSAIDFVMLYRGMPYYRALEELSNIAGITDGDLKTIEPKERRDPKHRIAPYLHESGILIREHLKTITNPAGKIWWEKWASRRFAKLDYYFDTLTDDDWVKAKDFNKAVAKYIKRKDGDS